MEVADVARGMLHGGLPLDANVATMPVIATMMAFIGRG
jgi:hypothetical protein